MSTLTTLHGPRAVVLGDASAPVIPPAPFVALLPAHTAWDPSTLEALIARLLDHGCVELCVAGTLADELHDEIDWIVEARDLTTTTTGDADPVEAAEYAVLAAWLASANLLVLASDDPVIVATIEREASRHG